MPNQEGGGPWWSIDHLLVDQDAIPTFVEVKRSSDTRIRREVVAQMLEYAANGTAYWRVETLRAIFEESERTAGRVPEDTVTGFVGGDVEDVESFWARLGENLAAARVRCIFVADEIPTTLRRLVEFMNEHLDTVEVLAVEIPQYTTTADGGVKALVPRLIGNTAKAQVTKNGPARAARQWDEESFMADVRKHSPQDEETARAIYEWAVGHADEVAWGKGRQDGSMIIGVRGTDGIQYAFTCWTYRRLEINFQYLLNRSPFRDDALRHELLERFNRVENINLPLEKVNLRPSISYEQFRQSQDELFGIMGWGVEQIRNTR